jgi:Flp pilus assembly protein TadG
MGEKDSMTPSQTSERGAVALELAIVLPILILLVFGIVAFGRGYNANVELRGAGREGARALALGATGTQAESKVQSGAPGLSSGSGITFPATNPDGTTNPTTCGTGDGVSGKNAEITANYQLSYTIPLLSSGTWPIQVTGVMRCET